MEKHAKSIQQLPAENVGRVRRAKRIGKGEKRMYETMDLVASGNGCRYTGESQKHWTSMQNELVTLDPAAAGRTFRAAREEEKRWKSIQNRCEALTGTSGD